MLEAIGGAKNEILLEMYWFGSDMTGRRFAAALSDKAREGVRVCITYDAVGSWEADRAMFDELRNAGCSVIEFNPPSKWRLRWRIGNRRNHRKQLIVDRKLGMTGGVNLADPWAPISEGGLGFRDDMILIEGPAVAEMRAIFVTTSEGRKAARAVRREPPLAAAGNTSVMVLANDHLRNRRIIERAYLRAIRAASRRVWIENSYFIPSIIVRRALSRAVKRGVDVRVVLPSKSDVPAVAYATRRLYATLLRRGVRLFEWAQSILHSKIAVVDDWCTVGTHNLDYRSWIYNLEMNVIVEDPEISERLRARIHQAISKSVEVDPYAWRFRPLIERLLEHLFYRFRRLL
ncbi:MAG TPA: phospholipase D-like domain-containing protein [Polyangiales bacterium]|jgi:cardiolipin synthase|nr:phospholipase D-like domain-containing protein [Polyangiales bacterium]